MKKLNREQRQAISILQVLLGLYKGVSGKDDPHSVAYRAEYEKKLLDQLARTEELRIRQAPEVKLVESRMKYYGYRP